MNAPGTRYHVAALQFAPEFGAIQANLDAVEAALDGITADLIVLPEFFASGYSFLSRKEARDMAEPWPESPTLKRMCTWSRQTGAMVVGGFPERDGAKAYNSAAVIVDGQPHTCYRKIHLFGFERDCFEPGDRGFPVITHRGLSVGVMICFDWMFPESTRSLALQGADIVAHPSNLVLPGWCQDAMRIRSLENRVYSVTANRYGTEARAPRPTLAFTGASQIVSPRGEVLAQAQAEGLELLRIEADVAVARDKSIPSGNDVISDRRPEWYREIVTRR